MILITDFHFFIDLLAVTLRIGWHYSLNSLNYEFLLILLIHFLIFVPQSLLHLIFLSIMTINVYIIIHGWKGTRNRDSTLNINCIYVLFLFSGKKRTFLIILHCLFCTWNVQQMLSSKLQHKPELKCKTNIFYELWNIKINAFKTQ